MEGIALIIFAYGMIGGNYAIYLLVNGRIEFDPMDFLFEMAMWPLAFASWVESKLHR